MQVVTSTTAITLWRSDEPAVRLIALQPSPPPIPDDMRRV